MTIVIKKKGLVFNNGFSPCKRSANKLNKSEETVKRCFKAGKFSNATKESDKEGWRISVQDIHNLKITNDMNLLLYLTKKCYL